MKRMLAAFACLGAAASLFATAPALAQAPQMSEEEATALARFAMPRAFAGLQQTCRGSLGADAYIYRSGAAVTRRLEAAAQGSWPSARRAILAMIGEENPEMVGLLQQMSPNSLEPFAEEMIAGMIATRIEAEQCGRIDRVLSLLDPLPAENLAALAGYVFVEAQAEGAMEGAF